MTCCAACHTEVAEPPVTWSKEQTDRGTRWLCDACTRDNLRSIEARLPEAWW